MQIVYSNIGTLKKNKSILHFNPVYTNIGGFTGAYYPLFFIAEHFNTRLFYPYP
jgi:hypothetical protein